MPTGWGVTVVGSANLDLTLGLAALPVAGQTVLSTSRAAGPGGKGLNQAVAAARAGARTRLVAAVGPDPEGAELLRVLTVDGIESLVRTARAATGLALVLVDEQGENAIVVSPGANAELVGLQQPERDAIADAAVLLMQLEVPLPTVTDAAQVARAAGTVVVLNAAPYAPLDDALLGCVDLLVVNEGEARALASSSGAEPEQHAEALLDRVPAVVVTLGPRGAVFRDRSGRRHHEPGRPVPVVDTTGAGDSFAGYLAAGLAAGLPVDVALARANTAAALCVQRPGAVPSVPRAAEVEAAVTS